MAGRLAGKTAFITAAGAGIGRATAIAFANEGATVHATDVNDKLFADFPKLPGLHTAKLDALDDAAVKKMIGDLPPLQVLFNCAGFVHNGTILDCTDDQWNFAFNLNVRAMFVAAKAAIPKMVANFEATGASASIINIASIASSIKGLPNRFVYGTSKAAVLGLTKSIAADFVTKGIRCNAVCPGTVDTPSLQDRINAYPDPVEARKMFIARQPMGRLAKAEEIAPIVVFLASDESVFATGNAYSVDGGMTI
ncbi:MAG: SDR family oxidoreductase [Betaproteobacteria bacterium]